MPYNNSRKNPPNINNHCQTNGKFGIGLLLFDAQVLYSIEDQNKYNPQKITKHYEVKSMTNSYEENILLSRGHILPVCGPYRQPKRSNDVCLTPLIHIKTYQTSIRLHVTLALLRHSAGLKNPPHISNIMIRGIRTRDDEEARDIPCQLQGGINYQILMQLDSKVQYGGRSEANHYHISIDIASNT